MVGKIEKKYHNSYSLLLPNETRCIPLATVLQQKRIRIGRDNGHNLKQGSYRRDTLLDTVSLQQTFNLTVDIERDKTKTENKGRKAARHD